jgi:two-component system, sensor histidine kinase and response regulator
VPSLGSIALSLFAGFSDDTGPYLHLRGAVGEVLLLLPGKAGQGLFAVTPMAGLGDVWGVVTVAGACVALFAALILALRGQFIGFSTNRESRRKRLLHAEHQILDTLWRSSDLVATFDSNGNLEDLNPAAAKFLGIEPKEPMERKFISFIGTNHRGAFQQLLQKCITTDDQSLRADLVWIASGGFQVELETTIFRISNRGDGEKFQVVGQGGGEKQGFASALRSYEERHGKILEAISEGVLQFDERCLCLECNSAVGTLLNLPRERIFGKRFEELVERIEDELGNPFTSGVLPGAARVSDRTPRIAGALRLLRHDGQTKWVSFNTWVLDCDSDGAVVRFGMSLRDITSDQESRAELLRAKELAEAASRAKTEFLAMMSHEIRTPLNGVIGFTDLLLGTELDRQQRRFCETIRYSGEALLDVVNDVLDFSKIEAGRLELQSEPYNLITVIGEVSALMSGRAEAKGIELAVDFDTEVPWELTGDSVRVRQVLTNLVGNAIKFTHRGHVLIETDRIARDIIRISVVDTGPGIPLEFQELLFRRFSQVPKSGKYSEMGTGLGLAIAKQLSEMMGGQIGYEANSGIGSKFWFTLNVPSDSPGEALNSAPIELAKSRILVQSPSLLRQRVLSRRLHAWDISVELVSNLEEANAAIQKSRDRLVPFDLILLDDFEYGEPMRKWIDEFSSSHARASEGLILIRSRQAGEKDAPESHQASILYGPLALPIPLKEAMLAEWARRRTTILGNGASEVGFSNYRPIRVLVVEDDLASAMFIMYLLERLSFEARIAASIDEALKLAGSFAFQLILLDGALLGPSAGAVVKDLRSALGTSHEASLIVLVGGEAGADRDRWLLEGIDDLLTKPVHAEELRRLAARWTSHRHA